MEITSKERLLTSLRLEEPDRVPICPRFYSGFISKVLGIPIRDLEGRTATYPMWKAQIETYRKFKIDAMIQGVSVPCPRPNVRIRTRTVKVEEGKVWLRTTTKTPAGALTSERCEIYNGHSYTTKHLVDDLESNFEKLKYLIPEPEPDFATYDIAMKKLKDDGLIRVGLSTPYQFWMELRGNIDGVIDFYKHPSLVKEYLQKYLNDYLLEYAKALAEHPVDEMWTMGYLEAPGFTSPKIFQECSYPYLKQIAEIGNEHGVPISYYLSGRFMAALDMIKDSGISLLEPLESPPIGDADLAEIKRRIGDKVCLKGNVDTIQVLGFGSKELVEKEALKCIRDAAYGGGYIFSATDVLAEVTPIENLLVFIKVGRQYGKYPLKLK